MLTTARTALYCARMAGKIAGVRPVSASGRFAPAVSTGNQVNVKARAAQPYRVQIPPPPPAHSLIFLHTHP